MGLGFSQRDEPVPGRTQTFECMQQVVLNGRNEYQCYFLGFLIVIMMFHYTRPLRNPFKTIQALTLTGEDKLNAEFAEHCPLEAGLLHLKSLLTGMLGFKSFGFR